MHKISYNSASQTLNVQFEHSIESVEFPCSVIAVSLLTDEQIPMRINSAGEALDLIQDEWDLYLV
jgi:hypothetical protein